MKSKSKKKSYQKRFRQLLVRSKMIWKFLTYEIWRITEHEVSAVRHFFFLALKSLILSFRFFFRDALQQKASALTYNTLLAIVPLLAILLSISRGFGIQELIEQQLLEYFPAQREIIIDSFGVVENYLRKTNSTVLIGFGMIFLMWTIITLITNIEVVFNNIWQVHSSRNLLRKVTDYLSIFLVIPLMILLSSALSIFVTTSINLPYFQFILGPLLIVVMKIAPYVITCLIFTAIYMLIPNTRVRFINALVAGVVAGVAFQLFQYFYISGQLWVARYNAIYGSFAALPLLLLWIQLSWLICLYGAELAYASQNVRSYDFEHDSQNISRRYSDFLTLLIATLVVKQFYNQSPPLGVEEISNTYHIPSKLTARILCKLTELGILNEVVAPNEKYHAWQPAMDIHKITVGLIITRIDQDGSEDFKIDRELLFSKEWKVLIDSRVELQERIDNILLIDL